VDRLQAGSYDFGMPVCQRCGEDNPERARFCLACAAPLAASPSLRREERKRVSVLFCDLVGFTSRAERLDVEDVRGVLAPYYQRLRADLEGYGGTVEKFIGDAVMALFGAPVAHEDDPERAVRAALSIRDTIAVLNEQDPALDLHVRVGVTTGEALVVLDARPVEGEGMASGDVVNTAARLQAAAPVDGVLVDETTYRATDRQITYQPAEPVQAKGKADLVMVRRAVAPRASLGVDVAHAPSTLLVGRERELELLEDALARVRDEHAVQLATLVGIPGMGKSRLVWELLQTVEAEPELTIWRQGRCLSYGQGVALWALGEVVKAQAGILDTDPADQATAKLDRSVTTLLDDAAEAAWVAGHLGPLVGLGGVGELGGDRQAEAFAAWRRFLEGLAEQGPTVLVIEDLHWADEVLLDFLDHLIDWATDVPLLVVCTARPELLVRRPGWGGGKANATTVSLAPLSAEDTARLVAALLDQALLPAETQAALLARAGGNPLYAEEYVRMLADRGFLNKVRGSWRLERAGELPLPESVQGIIAARLDGLAPEEKALLQDAAVLGKVGWLGALAALGGVEPFVLEQRLHALERRELLRRERQSVVAGERQYAFRHVLVRDVAYGQLPRAARAQRHRRAAEWLAALALDRAEDRAELLAHHWQAALQYGQAAGQDTSALAEPARLALREAGDRALALNAFPAAAHWYAAALELWPTGDPDQPRLLLQLGKARLWAENTGTELLEGARDALLAQGDREGAAEAERLLGSLLLYQGQGEHSLDHVRRAVALLEDAGPSLAKATGLTSLTAALWLGGQLQEAIQVGGQALRMAEELGLDGQRARTLNYIGSARVDSGDRGGLADLGQAVAIAAQATSPETTQLYGNLANTVIALGDLARGFELQTAGWEAAERFGLAGDLRWFRAERTFQDYWQGRWDAALDGADQFLTEAEAGSPHFMERTCRQVRGLIRLARGDLSGALADAARAVELAVQMGDPEALLPALAFHARALVATGQVEQGGVRVDELLTELAERGALATNPDWSGPLAIVLQVLERAAELVALAGAVAMPTPWLQAATAMAAGRFEEAADTYAKIGSRPDEAYARLRAAEQQLAGGRRAEGTGQLQRALAFYRQVAATGYLREGEALVAATA
jgi:class 3 adenylate cyclase/tetratricopeptide (TPR) repeat protein